MRKSKKEGNLFDKILKEHAEELFLPLIAKRLGIKIISSKSLPEKLQTTIEREVDFLRLITTSEGEEMIIHLEFQTRGDRDMVYRFGEYHGIELRKHKIKIKHFVIYLGKNNPRMKTQLSEEEVFRGFELINIHKINTHEFLSSQVPAEIMLAILADFGSERSEAIIRLIIQKLKKTSKSESELRKFITQLKVLSRLRNLVNKTAKIVSTMPISYDITKDAFFIKGKDIGKEEGREEGRQEGREEGRQEGRQEERKKASKKDRDRIKIMINDGQEIKYIAKFMMVSQKYVREIKDEMTERK